MITSLHNEKVKLAKALQSAAKTRRKEGKIVLEGVRLVRDALLAGYTPDFVLALENFRDSQISALLRSMNVTPMVVDNAVLAHVSETQQPQGIVAVFPMPLTPLPKQPERVLILDSLRDPGNLGTILRTAAAAGVQAVLLSPTCVDPYNPKALRAGMGAHFRVSLAEMNWEQITATCQHSAVYIADGGGEARYDAVDWRRAWALIIGGEARGAGEAAQQLAKTRIRIPMAAETESLNAAVAAGVILFEAARQNANSIEPQRHRGHKA